MSDVGCKERLHQVTRFYTAQMRATGSRIKLNGRAEAGDPARKVSDLLLLEVIVQHFVSGTSFQKKRSRLQQYMQNQTRLVSMEKSVTTVWGAERLILHPLLCVVEPRTLGRQAWLPSLKPPPFS
jgi:hypothetical protein